MQPIHSLNLPKAERGIWRTYGSNIGSACLAIPLTNHRFTYACTIMAGIDGTYGEHEMAPHSPTPDSTYHETCRNFDFDHPIAREYFARHPLA